ncbi:MAG: ABC transporter ATP-binding protein [Clostridiales bacterium]|nr:ABC transporter ATP-binding protein [Clostridiales bacterium]
MSNKKALKWIMNISAKQKAKMLLLIISNALFSVMSILFAFAIKGVIDGAVGGNKNSFIFYAVFIFGIVVLQFAFRLVINGLSEHIRGRLAIEYKSRVFSDILKKKYDKIDVYHSGELMNRLTNDVNVVSDGAAGILPTVVSAVTRLLCAVAALIILDWVFAVAFTVAGLLVFLVISLLRGKLKTLHKSAQETEGKSRSFMQECIENLLAVKAFSKSDKIEEQSKDLQEENFKVKMRRRNYSITGHAIYNFIFSAGYLFALIYGASLILGGDSTMTYGSLSAILQLVNNVQVPFASLSNVLPQYYAMIASAERLIEIENIESEPDCEQIDAKSVYSAMKGICFSEIGFTYDRDVVLKNSSMYVNKGDFVMISGASGGGKSTLIKLMLGVYELEKGEMYFDLERDKVPLGVQSRSLFSYVPQGNMIFSGTLRDNVTFINQDATDEEIERALKVAEAEEFVSELPEGLNTVVGEDGVGLSEGQIQRIAIARAVLCNAPIVLLDEATSALDDETERKVLNNFRQLDGITLFIISHRKAAATICNRVLRVKDKKITELN